MRNSLASAASITVLLLATACSDSRKTQSLPTGPQAVQSEGAGITATGGVPGTCVTPNGLASDMNAVFPPGPSRTLVNNDIAKMRTAVASHDYKAARALAFKINSFVIQQFKLHLTTGTPAQAAKLMNDVFCYTGLLITIVDPANADIIFPTDESRIIRNSDGNGGVSLPSGAVSEPTVIQFSLIPDTFGGPPHGPLDTKLDQYPTFLHIDAASETDAPLAKLVIVAVCPPPDIDPTVGARLRLGHQKLAGFELTPAADGSFLTCVTRGGAAPSRLPGLLAALVRLVSPKEAYAATVRFGSGGVGGTAGEFRDFGGVDPDVSFSGGVGGTAGEFKVTPRLPKAGAPTTNRLTPGAPSFTVVGGICTEVAAPAGSQLEPECSPAISLHTPLGTKLIGVPVNWVIGIGGGTVAPATTSPRTCGTFGATAATITDVNGEVHVCWTMGPTPGHNNNTVIATPGVGGDVPAGVTFVPASGTFTASALQRTPIATATGENGRFTGAPHPGSGTCSDGLTPVLSYSRGSTPLPSAPIFPGTYTLTVTCGDGGVLFKTVTATAPIVITQI